MGWSEEGLGLGLRCSRCMGSIVYSCWMRRGATVLLQEELAPLGRSVEVGGDGSRILS